MKEITVGMKFRNRSNGRVAYVAQIDEVGKCVDLMYLEVAEGQSKGGRASLTNLRGQKSWSYVHDDEVTETVEQPEDVSRETIQEASVEEKPKTLANIVSPTVESINRAEAQEEAEKKIKQNTAKSKKKAEVDENYVEPFTEVKRVLDTLGDNYHYTTGLSNVVVYKGDEKLAVLYKRKYKVRFYVSPELFERVSAFTDYYEGQGVGNYKVFKVSFFTLTSNVEFIINKLFTKEEK